MISQHPPDKLAIARVGVGTWFLLDLGVAEPPSKAHRQRTWQQVFWPQILSRITGMKWAVWQVKCFRSTCMQTWFKRTAQSTTWKDKLGYTVVMKVDGYVACKTAFCSYRMDGWMQLHMLPHLAGPQFSLVTGAAKSCIVRLGRLIPPALDHRT